jgi:hypothetical protein
VLQEPGLFSPPWAAQAKPAGARKLAPSLAALVESVRKSGRPGGETAVHITLANAPPDSLAQLRKLGFTIVLRTRDEVIGRIAVEKLEALAQLPFVVRIAPQ